LLPAVEKRSLRDREQFNKKGKEISLSRHDGAMLTEQSALVRVVRVVRVKQL
jgi:hypothetical protein